MDPAFNMGGLVTRREARAKGLKRYFTGQPCVNGHRSERTVKNKRCAACHSMREQVRRHHKRKTDASFRLKDNARKASFLRANPAKRAAAEAKRRAAQLQRTPCWADYKKILETYRIAELIGPSYHVDHVVPLQGKTVSGLHVHYNLQIILAVENTAKKNKWAG